MGENNGSWWTNCTFVRIVIMAVFILLMLLTPCEMGKLEEWKKDQVNRGAFLGPHPDYHERGLIYDVLRVETRLRHFMAIHTRDFTLDKANLPGQTAKVPYEDGMPCRGEVEKISQEIEIDEYDDFDQNKFDDMVTDVVGIRCRSRRCHFDQELREFFCMSSSSIQPMLLLITLMLFTHVFIRMND